MDRRLGASALVALALLGAMAGCGGSGSDGDSSGAAAAKARFIDRADAICAAGLSRKNAVLKQALDAAAGTQRYATPAAQEELIADHLLPPLRAMSERLGELAAPGGAAVEVRSMVAALDAGISRAEADPRIAIVNEREVFGAWNKRARAFGMGACSRLA